MAPLCNTAGKADGFQIKIEFGIRKHREVVRQQIVVPLWQLGTLISCKHQAMHVIIAEVLGPYARQLRQSKRLRSRDVSVPCDHLSRCTHQAPRPKDQLAIGSASSRLAYSMVKQRR